MGKFGQQAEERRGVAVADQEHREVARAAAGHQAGHDRDGDGIDIVLIGSPNRDDRRVGPIDRHSVADVVVADPHGGLRTALTTRP